MAQLTKIGAVRLTERSKKVKTTFKDHIFEAVAFFGSMVDISHVSISERDRAQ